MFILNPKQEAALARVIARARRIGGQQMEELPGGQTAYATRNGDCTIRYWIETGVPDINLITGTLDADFRKTAG